MRKPKPEKPKRDVYIAQFTQQGTEGEWSRWVVSFVDRVPRKGSRLSAAVFNAPKTSFEYVKNYVALRADLNLVSDVPAKQVVAMEVVEATGIGGGLLDWLRQNWPQHRFSRYGWSIIHVLTPTTDLELDTMGRQADIYLGRG